jgi:hypothetical protein
MLGVANANNKSYKHPGLNPSILIARCAAIYCGCAGAWLTSPTFLNWKSPNIEQPFPLFFFKHP